MRSQFMRCCCPDRFEAEQEGLHPDRRNRKQFKEIYKEDLE